MSIEEGRAIVPYQDQALEIVKSRSLVLPDSAAAKRFFLPSGAVVGRYGVIGFLMIDSKPENRYVSYTDGEWAGVTYREEDLKWSYPERNPSHYLNTDTGFKMIRYFALPPAVRAFFEKDKYLGDPLIDKCCREGTLPEELDEVKAYGNYAYWIADQKEVDDLIKSVIHSAYPQVTRDQLQDWKNPLGESVYLSFHPWKDFEDILPMGTDSIQAAIYNFDSVIERFDAQRVLTPRELSLDIEEQPRLKLHPAN